MEKIQSLAAATLNFVTGHAHEHGMTNTEIMNALAHIYVIYGFTVKLEDNSDEQMKATLIEAVAACADHMMTMDRNEKA